MVDSNEARALQASMARLGEVPAQGGLELILEALSHCVPVAAGLIQIVNLDTPTMMSGHSVRLPIEVLQSWMATPREHLARAVKQVLKAKDGQFWRADDLADSVRENLGVLAVLDNHGLGEGSGYKLFKRLAPTRGTEHVWLSLITERKARFPMKTGKLLKELTPAIQAAVERISVPLVASRPLVSQLMEEDTLGYMVVSQSGAVHEVNRRAYDLVQLYRREARVEKTRRSLADFVAAALSALGQSAKAWYLRRASTTLEVRRHELSARTHALPDDMVLLKLRELDPTAAEPPFEPLSGVTLSRRQLEIAELLVRTGLSYQGIAARLSIKNGTVRAVVPTIYREYEVNSRDELVELHATKARRNDEEE